RVEADRPAISPKRLTRYTCSPARTSSQTTSGNDEHLTDWIEQGRAEDLPHLHAFTRGLEFDRHAVNAALTLPFHNGRIEGVNTKTKMIKRQMY
ncbi:Transposase, partial [Haloechinothrix alba]